MFATTYRNPLDAGASENREAIGMAAKKIDEYVSTYHPVVDISLLPTLSRRDEGDYTLLDPRAYFAPLTYKAKIVSTGVRRPEGRRSSASTDMPCTWPGRSARSPLSTSLGYFLQLVSRRLIRNNELVVLYDLEHQTYLFVVCQNITKENQSTEEDWNVICADAQGDRRKHQVDYLRALAPDTIGGRSFTPGFRFERTLTGSFMGGKRKRKDVLRKGKVFQKKLWCEYLNGLARQKQQEDLAYAATQKQNIMLSCRPLTQIDTSEMSHPPPILVIEGFFNMLPEKKKSRSSRS